MSAVFPHDVGSTLREFRKRIRDLEAAASSGQIHARGAYFTGAQAGNTTSGIFNAFTWTQIAGDASLIDTSTNILRINRSGIYAAALEISTLKQLAAGAEWTPVFDPECSPWGNPFGTFTIDFPNYRSRWYAPGSKFVSQVAHLTPWRFNDDDDNGGAGPDALKPLLFYSGPDGNLSGTDKATAKLWVTYMSVYQDVVT